jgi:hypothetical protein
VSNFVGSDEGRFGGTDEVVDGSKVAVIDVGGCRNIPEEDKVWLKFLWFPGDKVRDESVGENIAKVLLFFAFGE